MKNLVLVLVCLGLLVLSSCKHVIDEELPGDQISSIREFFAANSPSAEEFAIDVSQDQMFTTKMGVQVFIGKGAFMTANGPATSGTVNFKITHLRTIKDMILADAPTQTHDGILISGGSFYLDAGSEVTGINWNSGGIVLQVPASPADPQMSLFNGYRDEGFYWSQAKLDSAVTTGNNQYFVKLDELKWINIDKYRDSTGPKATVAAVLPDGYDPDHAMAYLVFRGEKSVMAMYPNAINQNKLQVDKVPAGKKLTIVIIAEKDKRLHFARYDVTSTAADITANPEIKPATKDEVNAVLSSF
jgi:hypothetical protein